MDDVVLELRHLSTFLPTDRGVVRAVDDVSLSVRRSETLGIVGESGSGKSMLARTIMGLTPPHAVQWSGEALLMGDDLRKLPPKELRKRLGRDVAMVFQDPMTSLNPVVRVGRQLTEALRAHGLCSGATARRRALELLERTGIPNADRRLRAYPHELSGGMRQRVGIAIALACGPRLLIADEPTTALDVTVQRQILDLLAEAQRTEEMAMVLISHDMGVVATRADQVAVMYGGRIVEQAPTAELFASPRHHYTRALLDAVPRMDREPHDRIPVLTGRPRPVVDPVGCRFAPRCPRAEPLCAAVEPPIITDGAHLVACHFPIAGPSTTGERQPADDGAET
jgi:peptide/nickel transport system ATP-binding protein